MSSFQGSLDGLCGPYAIANALLACGLSDAEALFEKACSAPSRKRWPALLWEGVTFGDLQRMVRACLGPETNPDGVSATYPFLKNPPRTNAEYWRRFDAIFDESDAICAIVGLKSPWMHWMVVERHGQRLRFTDSDPLNPNPVKNRGSLHAGSRPARKSQWVVEPKELVVFCP